MLDTYLTPSELIRNQSDTIVDQSNHIDSLIRRLDWYAFSRLRSFALGAGIVLIAWTLDSYSLAHLLNPIVDPAIRLLDNTLTSIERAWQTIAGAR